jgi:hypothetical protein
MYQFARGDTQDGANSSASTTVSSAGRRPSSAMASVEDTSRKTLTSGTPYPIARDAWPYPTGITLLVVPYPWCIGLVHHWHVNRPMAHDRVAPLVFILFKKDMASGLTRVVGKN